MSTVKELKNALESLLFSSGKKLSVDELCRLYKTREKDKVVLALKELAQDLQQKESSLVLVEDQEGWRLTVKNEYLPFVRKIVSQTELPKSILETLAVIAHKTPVLQSEIIKIRTNKAYDHLSNLEKQNFITRQKQGRTKLIKLGQKFFEYFETTEEQVKKELNQVNNLKELEKVEVIPEELRLPNLGWIN
ncbi:SMC-Scp complex subunit ScpB [Candidatus Woesearchaeota archaeon]|nr:SMC-Scp complex subunit ScpB [Candidatus Woesearchaeota archaeon]